MHQLTWTGSGSEKLHTELHKLYHQNIEWEQVVNRPQLATQWAELVPQLPQTVTGTCCRNEVAVATYFLIEVAAATSHNHAYRAPDGSVMVFVGQINK